MEYIEIYVRMYWENLGDILGCNGIYHRKSWYIETHHIYPCIEFGRLGCACIIFKCFNECYHSGSSKPEPK